jgi:ATP-dependent exoDNAse (exonuclease V) beta subunit
VSVCVSAGAGSGKTFVLVERFLKLVRSGVDPREILTITFTEKAAQEMRERIARAFAAPEHERERSALDGAWISTIHGFCARLLRVYAVEADVDPSFSVLTELPLARVRRAAFSEAQAIFRRERPYDYLALVDRVRWGRDEDGLAGVDRCVIALHEALRAAGVPPRARASEAGGEPLSLDRLDRPLVESALQRARAAFQAYQLAVASHPRSTPLARGRAAEVQSAAAGLAALAERPFSPEVHRAILAPVALLGRGGQFREERQALAQALAQLAAAYVEGPARAVGAALDDLVARFDGSFRARKAQLAALDFSDLEERARELLESRPDVRADVKRRFRSVLVDEFQDTSRLQQKIVDLVRRPSGELAAAESAPPSLFAVGDVKQAIYGFRHAEVRGLLEVEDEVRAQGGLVVPLDASFRTRPSVLSYVDAVFERVFGEPGSEVRHQPLRSAESVAFAPKAEPSVEVIVSTGDRLEQGRRGEARAIAARLATIVEGRLLRGTNPLRTESFGKPLRYRDCAVLFRALTELPVYERALRERGVPYRIARGGGFFEASEVVDAIALLRTIASPRDDLALAAVLRSPLVGLSDDALLALALLEEGGGERVRHGWLARALERVHESPRISPEERASAAAFRGALEEVRSLRGRVGARDVLARALELTRLGESTLLRAGNPRGLVNLAKLLEIVEELEADPGTGAGLSLEEVALALEDLRAGGSREAEGSLAGGDEDAVMLLSVHAAKGLEWPLVVVADLGRGENPFGDPVAWSAETGSIPILRDADDPSQRLEPTSYTRLVAARKLREREESKRLLYVAMTRCRDHLVLAGSRGGSRSAGAWLAWSLGPLNVAAPPLATERDEVLGAVARTIPGPDASGVRVVLLGELGAEASDSGPGFGDDTSRAAAPAPLSGPLGPDAGARTLLDAGVRDRLRQGLPPSFLHEQGGLSPEVVADARAALARVRRPLRDRDLGASVYVVTEVLAWESCPQQYLYEHVLGTRPESVRERPPSWVSLLEDSRRILFSDDEPETEPSLGATRVDDPDALPRNLLGTATHRVLELGTNVSRKLAKEIVAQEVGEHLTGLGLARTVDRVLGWVEGFARSPLGQRAARAREVWREEPFLVRVPLGNVPLGNDPAAESLLLRGTVDLLFVDEAGPVVVDYKTNDLTPLEVPLRAPAYALQLQLYALALASYLGESMRGERWEAWLAFLAPEQAISVDVSPAALEGARERLARFEKARRAGDFTARPSPLCRTCAFREVCPSAAR